MCGQHHIHSVPVKPWHKDISFVIEPFRVGTGTVAIGVQDNIPVHQHNFPLLFRLFHITPEPFFLCRQHVGLELIHFPHDAVQHNEVNVAVIKGIKLVLIFFRRAFRQLEVVQIGQRHPLFPFQVIGFVVTQNRRDRNLCNHRLNTAEPFVPLVTMLPVIHQIAHDHKELCVLVTFPGGHGYVFPGFIIGTLAVRED